MAAAPTVGGAQGGARNGDGQGDPSAAAAATAAAVVATPAISAMAPRPLLGPQRPTALAVIRDDPARKQALAQLHAAPGLVAGPDYRQLDPSRFPRKTTTPATEYARSREMLGKALVPPPSRMADHAAVAPRPARGAAWLAPSRPPDDDAPAALTAARTRADGSSPSRRLWPRSPGGAPSHARPWAELAPIDDPLLAIRPSHSQEAAYPKPPPISPAARAAAQHAAAAAAAAVPPHPPPPPRAGGMAAGRGPPVVAGVAKPMLAPTAKPAPAVPRPASPRRAPTLSTLSMVSVASAAAAAVPTWESVSDRVDDLFERFAAQVAQWEDTYDLPHQDGPTSGRPSVTRPQPLRAAVLGLAPALGSASPARHRSLLERPADPREEASLSALAGPDVDGLWPASRRRTPRRKTGVADPLLSSSLPANPSLPTIDQHDDEIDDGDDGDGDDDDVDDVDDNDEMDAGTPGHSNHVSGAPSQPPTYVTTIAGTPPQEIEPDAVPVVPLNWVHHPHAGGESGRRGSHATAVPDGVDPWDTRRWAPAGPTAASAARPRSDSPVRSRRRHRTPTGLGITPEAVEPSSATDVHVAPAILNPRVLSSSEDDDGGDDSLDEGRTSRPPKPARKHSLRHKRSSLPRSQRLPFAAYATVSQRQNDAFFDALKEQGIQTSHLVTHDAQVKLIEATGYDPIMSRPIAKEVHISESSDSTSDENRYPRKSTRMTYQPGEYGLRFLAAQRLNQQTLSRRDDAVPLDAQALPFLYRAAAEPAADLPAVRQTLRSRHGVPEGPAAAPSRFAFTATANRSDEPEDEAVDARVDYIDALPQSPWADREHLSEMFRSMLPTRAPLGRQWLPIDAVEQQRIDAHEKLRVEGHQLALEIHRLHRLQAAATAALDPAEPVSRPLSAMAPSLAARSALDRTLQAHAMMADAHLDPDRSPPRQSEGSATAAAETAAGMTAPPAPPLLADGAAGGETNAVAGLTVAEPVKMDGLPDIDERSADGDGGDGDNGEDRDHEADPNRSGSGRRMSRSPPKASGGLVRTLSSSSSQDPTGYLLAGRSDEANMHDHLYAAEVARITTRVNADPTSWNYLQRALVHKKYERHPLALHDLNHAQALDPGNVDVLWERQESFVKTGGYQSALADLRAVLELSPGPAQVRAHVALCAIHRVQGHTHKALSHASQLIRLQPDQVKHYLERADLHWARGDPTAALEDWRTAAAMDPTACGATACLIEWARQHGDWRTVQSLTNQLLGHSRSAMGVSAASPSSSAMAALTGAVDRSTTSLLSTTTTTTTSLSYRTIVTNAYDIARAPFPKKLNISETHGLRLRLWRAEAEARLGHLDASLEILDWLVHDAVESPLAVDLYLNRGCLLAEIHPRAALCDLSTALLLSDSDAMHAIIYYHRAQVYVWMQKSLLAKQDLLRCIALQPAFGRAWLQLARLYETQGELLLALVALNILIGLAPQDVAGYVSRAEILRNWPPEQPLPSAYQQARLLKTIVGSLPYVAHAEGPACPTHFLPPLPAADRRSHPSGGASPGLSVMASRAYLAHDGDLSEPAAASGGGSSSRPGSCYPARPSGSGSGSGRATTARSARSTETEGSRPDTANGGRPQTSGGGGGPRSAGRSSSAASSGRHGGGGGAHLSLVAFLQPLCVDFPDLDEPPTETATSMLTKAPLAASPVSSMLVRKSGTGRASVTHASGSFATIAPISPTVRLAVRDLTQAIHLKPSMHLLYLKRGYLFLKTDRLDACVGDFNASLALNSGIAKTFYQSALILSFQGKHVALLEAFDREFRHKMPSNDWKVWLLVAKARHRLQDYVGAMRDLTKALTLNDVEAAIYLQRGHVAKDSGDYDTAIAEYSAALKLHGRYTEAFHHRALCYLAKSSIALALQDLTSCLATDHGFVPAYYTRAQLYWDQQKYALCTEDCDAMLRIEPANEQAHLLAGRCLVKLGQLVDALDRFESVCLASPDSALALYNRARVYQNMGRWKLALQDYSTVLLMSESAPAALRNRGLIYWLMRKYTHALGDLSGAIAAYPEDITLRCLLAVCLFETGQLGRAIATYREVIEMDRNVLAAWHGIGCAYFAKRRYAHAIRAFRAMLHSFPHEPSVYLNLGAVHAYLQQPTQADAWFDRGLALLVSALAKIDAYEEALDLLLHSPASASAAPHAPAPPPGHGGKAAPTPTKKYDRRPVSPGKKTSASTLGHRTAKPATPAALPTATSTADDGARFLTAKAALVACLPRFLRDLHLDPDPIAARAPVKAYQARFYEAKGLAAGAHGQWERAIGHMTTALRLDPTQASFYVNRGVFYERSGQLRHGGALPAAALTAGKPLGAQGNGSEPAYAMADYRRALQADPTNVAGAFNMANLYLRQQFWDRAEACYTAALSHLDPADEGAGRAVAIQMNLALAAAMQGDRRRGIALLGHVLAARPGFLEAHFNRGCLYELEGDGAAAEADFTSVLAGNTDDVASLLKRGQARNVQGAYGGALDDFSRYVAINA
ncbi:hypothetical protein CXG81DRAFT_23209 [Caulochytrium protostelioides]|uniref:TPR-like protein n=1 Tax=Caulochytrium protostelioides TaxID=1555241 RepID=A0A4P9XFA2_9FUNG|nr:hypothetical protein CXG81DRAFT_23209 [Caulochytrium protostelioides]|eukprot:RKP04257.1 hypothetical protein CXG81DRAFT_23209 [Caulochytrium protostelioides]